ncbi:PrpF domain-containing protein [Roseomonas harenae]|uniref:PrpF domain-containing protein n=1 Tax=Muricoccus harenae TaxID=2692566 RepID=UPI0013319CEB|nr:PrpF domain-containing protein [Roseomonas harenae]
MSPFDLATAGDGAGGCRFRCGSGASGRCSHTGRDEGITFRIHDANAGRIIVSRFEAVGGGEALVDGPLALDGVSDTGAPIRLDFLDPGEARSDGLFPSCHALDVLEVPGGRSGWPCLGRRGGGCGRAAGHGAEGWPALPSRHPLSDLAATFKGTVLIREAAPASA